MFRMEHAFLYTKIRNNLNLSNLKLNAHGMIIYFSNNYYTVFFHLNFQPGIPRLPCYLLSSADNSEKFKPPDFTVLKNDFNGTFRQFLPLLTHSPKRMYFDAQKGINQPEKGRSEQDIYSISYFFITQTDLMNSIPPNIIRAKL